MFKEYISYILHAWKHTWKIRYISKNIVLPIPGCHLHCFGSSTMLQGGPLLVINGVVTPINGLING